MTGDKTVRIGSDGFRALCAPSNGARLLRLDRLVEGQAVPVIVPAGGPKTGAFPLVPFSGRVRDGRMRAGGQTWTASPHPRAIPHAMHGDGWKRAWRVKERDARTLIVELDYPSPDWPFDHTVQMRMDL